MIAWQPIQPLPDNLKYDFRTFHALEREYRRLPHPNPGELQLHNYTKRRWAIENGLIASIYHITPTVSQLLQQMGLDHPIPADAADLEPGLLAVILAYHAAAFDEATDRGHRGLPISTTAMRHLHRIIVAHQSTYQAYTEHGRQFQARLLPGEFKDLHNDRISTANPAHFYCPPELVDSQISQLLRWTRQYQDQDTHPIILSTWFHHRFSQIHPFQDGNGRVSRALLAWQLALYNLPTPVVDCYNRNQYDVALDQADHGDLHHLLKFIVDDVNASLAWIITCHDGSSKIHL